MRLLPAIPLRMDSMRPGMPFEAGAGEIFSLMSAKKQVSAAWRNGDEPAVPFCD
jgi:hypothetical protein